MIKINKEEAMWLQDKGFQFKQDIFRTYSAHHKYYCAETRKVLNALYDYRQSKLVNGEG